jgi:hypothetical protein
VLKELLDSGQAANYLHLARQTLARLRCEGASPPYYRVGRSVLYDVRDLDLWLAQRRRTSTSAPAPASNGI